MDGTVEVTIVVKFLRNATIDEAEDTDSEFLISQCQATASLSFEPNYDADIDGNRGVDTYFIEDVELTSAGLQEIEELVEKFAEENGYHVLEHTYEVDEQSFVGD